MRHEKAGKPVGLLTPDNNNEKYYHERYLPGKDLEFFVEHYWFVKWNIINTEPFIAETLPHPSVHIVFEKKENPHKLIESRIMGIMEGKFSRELKGKGEVFGIKFKPGAFYPFYQKEMFELTNNQIHPTEVFGNNFSFIEDLILNCDDDEKMMNIADDFLTEILPVKDEKILLINDIIHYIISEKNIYNVEGIVKRFKIGIRPLQRLFKQYVGINPKWMIQRYRLHDAARMLSEQKEVDLVTIALNLGYFDQAHFNNDFKKVVGLTPSEFSRKFSHKE